MQVFPAVLFAVCGVKRNFLQMLTQFNGDNPLLFTHTSLANANKTAGAESAPEQIEECSIMSKSKNVVPEAREGLNRFKMEAANEVGVNLKQGYNGDLTSRQAGSIGGQMVKKMIESYENGLK